MSRRSIRVVLADDHPLMLSGIEARLTGERDIEVLGTAMRTDELVTLATELSPDVVVADLSLADGTLLDILPILRDVAPSTHVLVLSASDEADAVLRVLEAGARGFLSKETDSRLLADHIRAVHTGETVLDQHASAAIAARLRDRSSDPVLSPREAEVLRGVSRGLTNRQIAEELFVSASTVKTHFDRIFEKLGVHDRAAALAIATKAGILD